jgi:twitching motility two-component system response regulator PilG
MSAFVMVIDDSLVIRKILETCLHRAGYEVKSFPDGVEALRWLNTTEARIPDLVVVDVGLPKLDGYQVIQQIKVRPALERTKLVILSRRDGILDRLKGRLVGAHAYLTKPFKTDQLVAVIQASLGDAVPNTEGARRQGKHEMASSEEMVPSHLPAGVFPLSHMAYR